MKCPECKRNFGSKDIRLVAFHLACHGVPQSVVFTILKKLGYDESEFAQFQKYPLLTFRNETGSTRRFEQLLRNALKNKVSGGGNKP